jgi:hypothetical protein
MAAEQESKLTIHLTSIPLFSALALTGAATFIPFMSAQRLLIGHVLSAKHFSRECVRHLQVISIAPEAGSAFLAGPSEGTGHLPKFTCDIFYAI